MPISVPPLCFNYALVGGDAPTNPRNFSRHYWQSYKILQRYR